MLGTHEMLSFMASARKEQKRHCTDPTHVEEGRVSVEGWTPGVAMETGHSPFLSSLLSSQVGGPLPSVLK